MELKDVGWLIIILIVWIIGLFGYGKVFSKKKPRIKGPRIPN